MTPATTPFSQNAHKKHALHSRTAESSPTRRDPNLTIKASHAMQRGASYDDDFAVMRQKAETPKMPSTPNSARHKHRGSVDLAAFPQPDFMNMSNLQMNIPTGEGGYDASNYSPMSNTISSTMSSFQSSPEMTHLSLFEAIDVGVDGSLTTANLSALPASQSAVELGGFSSPIKEAPQLRSQSVSEINPEECGEDTGVTCDDIAAFISYVQSDSRWMCLFPDCGKRFGRKENIKAHVQTHLGDRQFRCRDCGKCFVRQHDLKRHANIHSGFKSYPCPCGKQFARHDALTRHRQRGMCIGAFEGTPKKVIKRGRPKKPRPDTEERLEKSAKTRQRALEKRCPGKYASSVSGSSASSSPEELFEDMDFTPSSPSPGDGTLQGIVRNIAVDPFSYTPPTSPGYSTGNCLSSQVSQHSYTPKAISTSPSPKFTGIPEEPQTLPVSNSSSRKSSSSYFGTPPELDVSSSSPAASKFFDLDASSEAASSQSMPLPFDHNMVLLNQDFDLSPALTKEESMNAVKSDFHDYFNAELEMTGFSFAHDKYADAFNSDDPFTDGFMNC